MADNKLSLVTLARALGICMSNVNPHVAHRPDLATSSVRGKVLRIHFQIVFVVNFSRKVFELMRNGMMSDEFFGGKTAKTKCNCVLYETPAGPRGGD